MSVNYENPCDNASSCHCLRCTKLTECLLANTEFLKAVYIAVHNAHLFKRVVEEMPPTEVAEKSSSYSPGVKFYDGDFDPELPSNSDWFARALAKHWQEGNEAHNVPEDFYD